MDRSITKQHAYNISSVIQYAYCMWYFNSDTWLQLWYRDLWKYVYNYTVSNVDFKLIQSDIVMQVGNNNILKFTDDAFCSFSMQT